MNLGSPVPIGMVLLAICGLALAEPLPEMEKEKVRGSLDGYELLFVHPEIQFPDTVPSPFEADWTLGPDMPLCMKGGVAGIVNNHLVVVPGIGGGFQEGVVQALDLATMLWTGIARIPKAPVYTTGVCARDSIIILSGRGGQDPEVGPAAQRLRFVDGQWVWDELPPLPAKMWYATCACVDDRWIVTEGGNIGNGEAPEQVSRDVWVLDLDNPDGGWRTVARYEKGVIGPMIGGVNGRAYFCGGCIYIPWLREEGKKQGAKGMTPWSNGYIRQKYVHCLDLRTGAWKQCADMPYARAGGVVQPYHGRYLLVFGGSSHSFDHRSRRPGRSREAPGSEAMTNQWRGHHDEVLLYDTVTDKWSVFNRPMPYGTNDIQATIHGDTAYVCGGEPETWCNGNNEDVFMIGKIQRAK